MCSQHMNKDDNAHNAHHEAEGMDAQLSACISSLESCEKERDEWKEKYLYARADFDNAQRRMAKDMERLVWDGQAKVLREVLDIVADFERALAQKQENDGFVLIYKRMLKILDQAGVKEIEVQQSFDPELHEAVAHVDAPGHESGSIVEVLQKGYRFKNEILRPARVSVAR
jgi:molecular chaperone GrpE